MLAKMYFNFFDSHVFFVGYKQVAATIMDRVNMKHKVRIMFDHFF